MICRLLARLDSSTKYNLRRLLSPRQVRLERPRLDPRGFELFGGPGGRGEGFDLVAIPLGCFPDSGKRGGREGSILFIKDEMEGTKMNFLTRVVLSAIASVIACNAQETPYTRTRPLAPT